MSKPKKRKTPVAAATTCSALAARIPFRMLMHMSGEKCHIGRYTNEKLGIGPGYTHLATGAVTPMSSEAAVFEFVGLPCAEPWERDENEKANDN